MLIPSQNKLQYGVEAVLGDGAAATIQPIGVDPLNITPKVTGRQVPDYKDTYPSRVSTVGRRWSEGVHAGMLNYDLAYLMLDGMFGKATPAGGVYSYTASADWAGLAEASRVFYYGQTGAIFKVAGVLPKELTISINSDGEVRFNETWFGQPVADGASFAALSDADVGFVMPHHATLYLDPGLDATAGTTELSDLGLSGEVKISCAREPFWHLGNQSPDAIRRGKWGGSMSLEVEADATRLALLGDILDAASALEGFVARIELTNGADELLLDFAGEVVEPPSLVPQNEDIVTVPFNMMPAYGSDLDTVWAAQLTVA